MTTTAIPFIIHIAAWIIWLATGTLAVIAVRRLSRELKAAREEAEDYRVQLAIASMDAKSARLILAEREAIDRITAAPGYMSAVDLGREIQNIELCAIINGGRAAIERLTFCPNKL